MASRLPRPALVASHAGTWRTDAQGRVAALGPAEAAQAAADTPHLLVNAALVAARLGVPRLSGLDLLELFAFVAPARFIVPSAAGLAGFLGLDPPPGDAAAGPFLQRAAAALLARVQAPDWPAAEGAHASATALQRAGWVWAPFLLERLPPPARPAPSLFDALPRREEAPPRPAPRACAIEPETVLAELARLRGPHRPPRAQQQDYALAAAHAFQPRATRDGPNLVIAEAGTGTGKTLGYLAPAVAHARQSGGQVWLSTYTRALQRQLRAETQASLAALERRRWIVVRKGRENYLCLLNLEDALQGAFTGQAAVFAQLVARWARFTRDGDMVGGDLPGWLAGLFRRASALPALTDRRGECIRAACPHWRCCFIEKSVAEAAGAALVIANHALVMASFARGEAATPLRLVFDEGHHLHDAADSAFALALTGAEGIEMRRWFLGPEGGRRRAGRRRGLAARLLDVGSQDSEGGAALEAVLEAARALPAEQWLERLVAGEPEGPLERLLARVRAHVLARTDGDAHGFTLEAPLADPVPGLVEAAGEAGDALERLAQAAGRLRRVLARLAADPPEWLDQPGLARIEAADAGLELRVPQLAAWRAMLARLGGPPDPDFVDWAAVTRAEARELDAGLFRHWLDPMRPLAAAVLARAHGVLVTSATLADAGDAAGGEAAMEAAAGAPHLAVAPRLFRAQSPFDHGEAARIFIATDVERRDPASLAHAHAVLIEAAGGGALCLFTAIARLREVHARIADRLARRGLPLYAQHVDPMDTGTLVDLFRAEPHATLMGTDALRDGVDVPGESLRLILFEGVPWSRPTILETARRAAAGGAAHEDRMVRRRLAQAYGRLIRSATDRGVFVLLGRQVPSRLLSAFPPDVPVLRRPLAEVAAATAEFLGARKDCPAAERRLGRKPRMERSPPEAGCQS
jgi:ATP-dependent DNA helicase DinG